MDYSIFKQKIEKIVEIAGKVPDAFKVKCFEVLLNHMISETPKAPPPNHLDEINSNESNFLISQVQMINNDIQFTKSFQLKTVNYVMLIFAVFVGLFKLKPSITQLYSYIAFSIVIFIIGILIIIGSENSLFNSTIRKNEIVKFSKFYADIESKIEPYLKKNYSKHIKKIWILILSIALLIESFTLVKIYMIFI